MPAIHDEEPLLAHLAVCVTFHYVPERLVYLYAVISNYVGMAHRTDIYVITNTTDTEGIECDLPDIPNNVTIEFVTPSGIGHPFLLTWSHREVFLKILDAGDASHFLYTEDDLMFGRANVKYWLQYRQPLREQGFIPSFFRVEQHLQKGWVSSDCTSPVRLGCQRVISVPDAQFICFPNPYQAMYFLDRELMEEFADSPAMSPDFGKFGIRERAALGLTFVNVPPGYRSRNVVLVDFESATIPTECWIHHLPNTYANDPESAFGSLSLDRSELFDIRRTDHIRCLLQRLTRTVKNRVGVSST